MQARVLLPTLLLLVATRAARAATAATAASTAASHRVEELVVDSPAHIDALFKRSLKEYAAEMQEREGGTRGKGCSRDEQCQAHERCSKIGRCRPRDSDVSDACRYGFITCAHEEGSPMRRRAEDEADRRLGRPNKNTEEALRLAMLPQPGAAAMMALPAPGMPAPGMAAPGMAEDADEAAATVHVSQQQPAAQLAVSMAAQVSAIALVEDVANGALAASGALPSQVEKWAPLAAKGKERVSE
jgi:hypothetical protein